MAMNKKEAAELAEAKERLARAMALHWPIEPKPDPVSVEQMRLEADAGNGLFIGWSGWSWNDSYRVAQGCSNGVFHDADNITRTSTQGAGQFYATKDQALLAVRWELCERCAKTLAQLDAEYIAAIAHDPTL